MIQAGFKIVKISSKPKFYTMQKMLLSLAALFFLTVVQAQRSNMIFFTPNEEKFYLVVNGIQQNGQPMANVKITEMSAPLIYNVRIRFEDTRLGIINDKVSLEPGTEKSWSIQSKKKKGSDETEYVIKTPGELPLDEVSAAGNSFPQEQVIVYHTEPLPGANADGVTFSMNVNEQGGNVSFNMGSAGTTASSTSGTVTTTHTTGISPVAGYCSNPLDGIVFRQQLDRVRSQTTGAGRKIVAEKIAQSSCLTSQQVYELCDALYLNNDKLSLAKYCYTRCFDPQHYEEVYKALPVSSMVKELDEYITRTGRPFQSTTTVTSSALPVRTEYVPGYNGPFGCAQPMDNASFSAAKSSIQDADFESTKMSTAKTITGANCLTTDQVVAICSLFDFENSKLDFAKFAYTKTYDKGNYFKVNKVFEFDSSKEELNKFVQGK